MFFLDFSFSLLVLEPDEQLSTLQLLIYLLPPCNCDTLHRLLQFLSTVASHAEDSTDKDGQEVGSYHSHSLASITLWSKDIFIKIRNRDPRIISIKDAIDTVLSSLLKFSCLLQYSPETVVCFSF